MGAVPTMTEPLTRRGRRRAEEADAGVPSVTEETSVPEDTSVTEEASVTDETTSAGPDAAEDGVSLGEWIRALPDEAVRWATTVKHASYSFAALRIIYGLIILLVLVTSALDRQYLWGIGSRFIDPVATTRGYPIIFEAIFNKSNPIVFDIAYVLLGIFALAFMIGFATRVSGVLTLLFWIGLSVNSTLLTNGGDTVLRITLLFALFADLGGRWSVDAWLRKRGRMAKQPEWMPRAPVWLGPLAHNTALILCAYQIILIYISSAFLKLQGVEWLNGTAVYYSLALDVFRPFPWLNDLATMWDFPVFALTWLTIALQLLFPVLLVWRPTRIVALVGITGTHLGIGLFLGLWPFSLAMIALDFLFVRDVTWRWVIRLVSARLPRPRARARRASGTVEPA